jgi:SET domain-containing protein
MLVIETYVGTSEGKGIGLFAKQIIPKGFKWWVRNEKFDKKISIAKLRTYSHLAITFIKTYGFLEATGNWYLCIDNARFSNHSDTPNTSNILNEKGELISCIAAKEISANEEILCNYRETCLACISNLGFINIE